MQVKYDVVCIKGTKKCHEPLVPPISIKISRYYRIFATHSR